MNFSNFRNDKHPSAEMRGAAITQVVEQNGVKLYGTTQSLMTSAAMAVHRLSERFLYRQYYHRDQALAALEAGDIEEAKRQLQEIGNSGHNLGDKPLKV